MSVDEPPSEEIPLLVAPGMYTKPHRRSWKLTHGKFQSFDVNRI